VLISSIFQSCHAQHELSVLLKYAYSLNDQSYVGNHIAHYTVYCNHSIFSINCLLRIASCCMHKHNSLAAAVGLARVWQSEQAAVPCFVCLPSGSHPTVAHFLALHKNLFPVIALKDIVPGQVSYTYTYVYICIYSIHIVKKVILIHPDFSADA
jgi:hypothetical protein